MKADDDTYVAMKNLREYLSQYDPKQPHYFGLIKWMLWMWHDKDVQAASLFLEMGYTIQVVVQVTC